MLQQVSTLVDAANRLAVCEQSDSEALRRLNVLCRWFDEHLQELPQVVHLQDGIRRVNIFGIIAWVIDDNNRKIDSGKMVDGEYRSFSIWFSVLSPLGLTPTLWLVEIMDRLSLTFEGEAAVSMGEGPYAKPVKRLWWVSDKAFELLHGDPRFIHLTEVLLPAAFALPQDAINIAVAARHDAWDDRYLDHREFNRIWRHIDRFKVVARDTPNLMGLFSLLHWPVLTEPEFASPDPILSLKGYLKSNGLSEATWRYVVRHSPSLFQGFWNEFTNVYQQAQQTNGFLQCLQAAKLPPPPTDGVVSLLGKYHCDNFGQRIPLLVGIPPMIVRAAIIEGNRRDDAAQLESFAQELRDVFWWSGTLKRPLDKNQLKAGWPWLLRQTQAYLRMENQIAGAARKGWTARLPDTEIDGHEVFPLDSAEKLVRFGFSMRNCLADCVEDCACGKAEYYALRKTRSGKVEYCIGFKFDEDGVSLSGVKGFANGDAPPEAKSIADELLRRLHSVQKRDLTHSSECDGRTVR